MNRLITAAIMLTWATFAIGCSNESENNMPQYKKNPSPSDLYDLTITVSESPGLFRVVEGWVQYDITNMDCLPPADDFSGVQTTSNATSLPITLKKIDSNTYQGQIALDGLIDDDYFGHGTCHFKPMLSRVRFQAAGAPGETRFLASLYTDNMQAELTNTSYYWRGHYPEQKNTKDYLDHGMDSPEQYKESIRSELFSIIISARRAQP